MNNNLKELVILAVTQLGHELCVAGVDENGQWFRPTIDDNNWRQYYKNDIYDKTNQPVVELSNIVNLSLIKPIPKNNEPHIEDWQYDRLVKPVLIEKAADRKLLKLFDAIKVRSLAPLIEKHERSLCLIEPDKIIGFDFANKSIKGKYQPKIKFVFCGTEYNWPVTDAKWRALGLQFSNNHKKQLFNEVEFKSTQSYNKIYLAVGLSRWHAETNAYHPMIIGVHLIPNYSIAIDYNNL